MSAPEEIRSWIALAETLEACRDGRWIFRGETAKSWDQRNTLRPKAGRVGSEKGAARKVAHNVGDEEKALNDFIRQSRPHIGHVPASQIEWLAIAQHHGMSTRLLDWTESLLVAAYFATRKANTAVGIIYGAHELRPTTKSDETSPFKAKRPGIYRPPHLTSRIPAQRSVFTLHPDPTEDFYSNNVRAWVIPPASNSKIKVILDACAINEASLFPDLDGLSRYLGWRYKWGKP